MRPLTITTFAFVFASLVACNKQKSPEQISDSEATSIVEQDLLSKGYTNRILTGNAAVLGGLGGGQNDFANRRISMAEYKEVVGWSTAGLVTVSEDNLITNGLPRWNNFSEAALGVVKRIRVSPTTKGTELDKDTNVVGPRDTRFLYAEFFTVNVDNIVSNDEQKRSVDLFHVVKGTFEIHWTGVGKSVYLAQGRMTPVKRDFVALLRFDAFHKTWKVVAADYADDDKEFRTDTVAQYLARS